MTPTLHREPVIGLPETRRDLVIGEVWRLGFAVLIAAFMLWGTTMDGQVKGYHWNEPGPWIDLVLGLVATALLLLRRRHPLEIALTIGALGALAASAQGAWWIALTSLASHRRWFQTILAATIGLAASTLHIVTHPNLTDNPHEDLVGGVVSSAVLIVLAVLFGLYVGARRELFTNLRAQVVAVEREQSMRVAQARINERARIAREMHDVLAHRISVVAMHSGALGFRDDLTPTEVKQTADVIQSNAQQALVELRGILGVLRGSADEVAGDTTTAAEEPPQPTIRDLPELARSFRDAGQRVDLVIQAPYEELAPTTSRSAYRIVQESLTNAAKHAPGQPVVVTVRGTPGERVDIEVRNSLPPKDAPAPEPGAIEVPGSGMGLIGLTERAVLTGGELRHGEHGDWFVVSGWLPWGRE